MHNISVASGFPADHCMKNGGLGGNNKGLVSFYRNKEESAFERHRSRVPFDKAQDSIIAVKKQINIKKILAVINATYAVAKRKPEKFRLAGIRTLTSAIPVQRSNQLSYQANWELVIKLVRNIPGWDEDEIMNI